MCSLFWVGTCEQELTSSLTSQPVEEVQVPAIRAGLQISKALLFGCQQLGTPVRSGASYWSVACCVCIHRCTHTHMPLADFNPNQLERKNRVRQPVLCLCLCSCGCWEGTMVYLCCSVQPCVCVSLSQKYELCLAIVWTWKQSHSSLASIRLPDSVTSST